MTPLSTHSIYDLIQYAIKNNCSRKVYDLLVEANNRQVNFVILIICLFKIFDFLESSNI